MDAQPIDIGDYEMLIAAVRARIVELNTTYEAVEHAAGLQSGYLAKLLGPGRRKCFGPLSLFIVLPALGWRVVAMEDAEALARVRDRLVERKKPHRSPLASSDAA